MHTGFYNVMASAEIQGTLTTMANRKERIKEQNRNDILDAGERVFSKMGYHLATVELIAQEAEFAVGTLYNFFKNKQELYDEVMERVGCRVLQELETEVLSHDDVQQALVALINLKLRQFDLYRNLVQDFISLSPLSQVDPVCAMPKVFKKKLEQIIIHVSSLFERGINEGLFIQEDPISLTVAFNGMTNGLILYWTQLESPPPLAERCALLENLAFRLVGKHT